MEKYDQNSISQADDILVVDDSITSLQLLTEILTKEGYQVRPVERPQLAIESALAHPPSLILLDLKMLEVNGIEVCRRLKQDERTREVPIIFLSALQDVRDRIHGFEAGGVDFINKPYHELEVLARVKTHLKLRELQLHLEDLVSEHTAELKQAYASIRKSEAHLRRAQEVARVGSWDLDLASGNLFWSDETYSMFGVPRGTPLDYEAFLCTVPPEDREHVDQSWQAALRGAPYDIEHRIRVEGEVKWVREKAQIEFDEAGLAVRGIGIFKDITERKRAEESLRRREAILQAVAYAAEHFLKAPSWEDDVDLVLARLGQAAEVSRVYVFENHTDAAGELLASQRYEWVAPGVTAQLDNPDMRGISWRSGAMRRAAEILGSGGFVSGHVRDFLPAEQEMMSAQDIQSMVVVPIFADDEWWGFMGFDECVREREWSAAEIDALKAGASTLGAAIHRKRSEEALQKSEKRFRDVADNALEWIWEVDSNGKYTYVSPVVERILGYKPEEILQKHFYDLFYPDDKEELKRAAFEVFAGKEGFREFINRNVHKNGKVVWLSTSGIPIIDERGELVGYRGADIDITEQKQAEDALRESATRLQLATAATRIGHWDWDLRTNEVYFSQEWKRQLGYEDHEIPNRFEEWESRLHPDDRQRTLKAVKDYIADRRADYAIEFRLRHKDASYRWIYTRAEKQFDDTGKPCRLFGCHVDITEQKQAEQALQEYQQKLKSLVSQLTITEERERRRIAADLHDHIGHSLALARMQLKGILETQSELEKNLLVKDISNVLLKALQDTRSLIFELSSPSMNEIGLAAAISEWLEEQIAKRYDLEIEFIENIGDDHRNTLDENVRALLFRNVQELLANVVKHARANKVLVYITEDDARVKIVVEDDGVGFDPDTGATKNKQNDCFGLFSIRERMTGLGGSFDIQSEPGKGCRVVLTVPVEKGKD